MRCHRLGQGLEVSAIGLGSWQMTPSTGEKPDDDQSIAAVRRAIDQGITFLDTAPSYGDGYNEQLIGRAVAGRRDQVIIGTKYGFSAKPTIVGGKLKRHLDGRPESVRKSCDESLANLGVDTIDIYYQHRVDPAVPVEETWGAVGELVDAGKVRFAGICDPDLETLRRAHATHPVTAVQSEYSLFRRDIEIEMLPEIRRIGAGLVCFCPLSRGMLTGRFRGRELPPDDYRHRYPRFYPENLQRNLELIKGVDEFAIKLGVTTAQLAIAWLLAQGRDVVPIPGMELPAIVDDNVGALDLELSAEDLQFLDKLVPVGAPAGAPYPEESP